MNKEKPKKTSNNAYWIIGILVVIIILLGSALLLAISGQAVIILNYLSVSSQVASIVLAIVAIVFAFTESQKSNGQLLSIQNSINELQSKILEYAFISDYAKVSIGEFKEKLEEFSTDITKAEVDKLSDVLDEYTEKFETLEKYTISNIETDAEKLGSMFKLNKKFGIDSTLGVNTVASFVERKRKK